MTDEEKKTFQQMITEALSAQNEVVKKQIEAAVAASTKAVMDAQKANASDDSAEDTNTDTNTDAGGKPDPMLAQLQAQLKALAKQNEEAQAQAKASEASAKTARLLSEFDNAARAAGVDANRIPALRALLHNAEGRLTIQEDGTVGMNFKRDGYEEHLAFDKALPEYLKTDVGKQFMPPTNISGTGDHPAGGRAGSLSSGGKFDASEAFNRLASLAIQ